MAQANSHNSTRRAFLSTTAVAAAAIAIVAARAVVLASTQAEDPTFLIETHRVAESEHAAACAEHSLGRLGWLIIWLSVWAFD